MRIEEFLHEDAVTVNLKATKKAEVIKELVELLSKTYPIKDKDKLIKAIMEREELGSTGIGQGVGIPHAKSAVVKGLKAAIGISHAGVNFDSLDGGLTHIFFLLVAPEDAAGPHLKALARISRILKDKHFRDLLLQAKDGKTLINIIKEEDIKS